MITNLPEQISTLQREIYEMKAVKAPTFPDIFQESVSLQKLNLSSTETTSNAFVICVNRDTFQLALKQIHRSSASTLNTKF